MKTDFSKTWPTKKLGEMKKAWLVYWNCHNPNEDECLRNFGIKEKIVDVVSVRKDFGKIVELAKDIFQRDRLSFSEKVFLSNYSKGEKRRRDFFGRAIPVFTHYQTGLYRNLMESTKKGLKSKETRELLGKWRRYPEYITVGHNPYLEIRKVFNLAIYQEENGNEVIEWDWPLPEGGFKKEKCEFKR